jgi:hypothetical protein
VDWRDVLDDGGTEQPTSADMRHQLFARIEDDADDKLRAEIRATSNTSLVAREARTGRQTIYDFLAGGPLQSKTRNAIKAALRRISRCAK